MFYPRKNIPREVSSQASSLHSGSSSQLGSKLETANCVILRLYWAPGLNRTGNGYHVALRQLVGPEGWGWVGAVREETANILQARASSACVVMNSYLGLEGCAAGILVFVTLTKKALLLIVSRGAACAQYSQPFLSLILILPLFQP